MRTLFWIIIISISFVIVGGGLISYFYRSQPIPNQVMPFYAAYTMVEYFGENESGFDSIQVGYYRYLDPLKATIGVTANGPHKFNDCNIMYQGKGSNKLLWQEENITNRGEGFYDDPTRVLNSTNRLIFECNNPPYSLSWPYLTLNGIAGPENDVSLIGKFEPKSNIILSIYSCTITACEDENKHLIIVKSVSTNQTGDLSYSFTIPQTNDNVLYVNLKVGNQEYTLGTPIKTT